MSKTEVKNGSLVEQAALAVALAGEGVWWGYFTIADVAKYCGKSKPTVQKYLNILEHHGQVKNVTKQQSHQSTKLYKWTGTLVQSGE